MLTDREIVELQEKLRVIRFPVAFERLTRELGLCRIYWEAAPFSIKRSDEYVWHVYPAWRSERFSMKLKTKEEYFDASIGELRPDGLVYTMQILPEKDLARSFIDSPDYAAYFEDVDTGYETGILLVHAHLVFAEYERFLVLKKNGKIVAQDKLYTDSGSGSLANVYRIGEGVYLLIDMNGYWYEINAGNEAITENGFHREEKPQGEYLGAFSFDEEKESFLFIRPNEKPESSPYLAKDPKRYE